MITKEGLPGLQRPTRPRHHVFRNRGLGNVDADLEQFTMDLGSSPERILKTHSSDKVAHLFSDPRSVLAAHSRLASERWASGTDPRRSARPGYALSKHVQLMTQNQKFSVKPPSRLEAIAHHADEKEGDCDHQRGSCSDSGTAATPADAVFGSDRGGIEEFTRAGRR